MPTKTGPRQLPAAASWRRVSFGFVFGLALFGVMCGTARSQDAITPRLATRDAMARLGHADPVVRGEAALVAAGSRDREVLAPIAALTTDSHAECRHRALLALGVHGAASAVEMLDACLRDGSPRGETDAVVAAFALGLAPETVASGATTRVLTSIVQGSWKRQHDRLVALLLGLSLQPERHDAAALQRLLADDSNRDPEVRGLLWTVLLPMAGPLSGGELEHVLARGEPAERVAVLRFLARDDRPIDGALAKQLAAIVQQGKSAEERGLALTALARSHHELAIELASRTVRSAEAAEAAPALGALLALGGARVREPLAQRVCGWTDPLAFARGVEAFQAPLTSALADRCAEVAADAQKPLAARAGAACALARQQPTRALPWLRTLLAEADGDNADRLARALLASSAQAPTLARLFDGELSVAKAQGRWTALLRAGHPQARRELLARLATADTAPVELAAVLTVWRHAEVLRAPQVPGTSLPAPLRALFRD